MTFIPQNGIVAIDPGPTQSGWVVYCPQRRAVWRAGVTPTAQTLEMLAIVSRMHRSPSSQASFRLAIEEVQSYGRPVGRPVFETCRNSGSYQQAWCEPEKVLYLTFARVKSLMGLMSNAKESGVRQQLRDWLSQYHGVPETRLKGKKAAPGPLYGVKDHAWSALAVAIAADIEIYRADYTAPARTFA